MIVYLNGEYLDAHDAKISPFDRGFLFGDGVYEVCAVYQRHLYEWAAHCRRLFLSMQRVHLSLNYSEQQLADIAQQLLEKNGIENATLYLQVSRGAVIGKRDHFYTPGLVPTVFAYVNPWPEAMLEQRPALKVITLGDERWQRGQIKSVNLLANTEARQQVHAQQLDEAILTRGDEVVEGTSSNVLLVKDGSVITPPEQPYMLTGITRQVLRRLANENGLPFIERRVSVKELNDADEIWITSTVRELRLVSELNGKAMPSNAPVFERMRAWFNADKRSAIANDKQRKS